MPVLIVEAGGETTGLLVSGGERVEAARAVLDAGTGGELVVSIGDRLLAGRRLGPVRNPGDRFGAWAVVIPRRDGVVALVVDRVVKLTMIHPARLFPIDTATGGGATWYAEADVVLPVLSVGAACGDPPDPVLPGDPPRHSPAARPRHETTSQPGVRVDCGGIAVVLPFEIVNRALDSLPEILDRRPRDPGSSALPVLDTAALFGQSASRRHGPWLAIQACDGELILTANALRLEPYSDGPAWRPLPAMPPASVAMFDRYARMPPEDGSTGCVPPSDTQPSRGPFAECSLAPRKAGSGGRNFSTSDGYRNVLPCSGLSPSDKPQNGHEAPDDRDNQD